VAAKLTVVTAFKTEGADKAEREALQLSRAYQRVSAQLDPAIANQQKYERAQRTLERALKSGKISQEEYNRQLALAKSKYADASGGANLFSSALARAKQNAVLFAAALASAALIGFIALAKSVATQIFQTGSSFQSLRVQLETATGSMAAANAQFARIKEFATRTPFEVDGITKAYIRLRNVGINPTNSDLEAFGNIAAANSKDITDFSEAVIGAITGEMERLKAFGIVARQEGDKVRFIFRGTETEVAKNAEAIVAHLIKIGNTEFAGGMERQAATVAGALSNLQDAWDSALDTVAQRSGVLTIAEVGLRGVGEELGKLVPRAGNLAAMLSDHLLFTIETVAIATAKLLDILDRLGVSIERKSRILALFIGAHYANMMKMIALINRALDLSMVGEREREVRDFFAGLRSEIEKARVAAQSMEEGQETLGQTTGKTGRVVGDVKSRIKDLTKEIAVHTKAISDAEKAISEAQKKYQEISSAIDSVSKALGGLSAIELDQWIQDTFIATGEALARATGNVGFFLEAMGRVPQTAEDWRDLADAIAEIDQSLDDLAGRGTIEPPELEMDFPLPTEEEWKEMNEAYKATISEMSLATEAMMKRAWENVQDAAADAVFNIFDGLIDTGSDAVDELLKSFLKMLAQLLIMWLVNVAKRLAAERAAAAAAAAAWKASGSASGGGGGGGWMQALAGLFGGGGGGVGVTGVSTATPFGVAMPTAGATSGTSSTSLMAGGALGALAIVGVTAAFAYWAHTEAAKKAAKRWFGVAEVREGWNAIFGSAEVVNFTTQFRDKIREIFTAIGGVMSSLPEITVDVRATGKEFRSFVEGQLVGIFKTYEEAFSAAALKAIEQSDLSRMIPEIAEALSSGAIKSVEQLVAVADVFARIGQVTDPVGQQIRQFLSEIEVMTQTLIDAGIAASALAEYTAAGWQAIRDQITGATKSAQELFNERMEAFNRERDAEEARLKAIVASSEAAVAAAQIEIARTQAMIASLQALAALTDQQLRYLSTLLGSLATAEAALASASAAAAAAQAALDALPAPIKPGEFKGGGGSGSRKSDMEALRDLLDQMAFDRLLSGMTELEAGLARLASEYDQNLEKAHGNAELIAQLTEEYRLQAEQLLRNVQLSAVDAFQDFMGIGASPFAQLQEQWQDARKAVEEAGFGADRAAQMLARLNRRYEEQLDLLSRQTFVGIGDGLLGLLERYYGGVDGFERFRMNLERIRFELELVNLRLQFEILKANGTLSEKMLKRMQRVFDFIDKNPIDWGKFVTPDVPIPGLDSVNDRFQETNNLLEEMARRLVSAKEGITDFLLSLQTGQLGGRSSAEMFQAAYDQFQRIVTQGRAGNIQALEEFPEIARRLAEITRERFGSGASFQDILAMIEDAGIDLLNVQRVTQDNVVFDPAFLAGQRDQIDLQRAGVDVNRSGFAQLSAISDAGFAALAQEGAQQTRTLRAIADRLAKVEAEQRQTREYLERKAS
jgi:hypothetical protein